MSRPAAHRLPIACAALPTAIRQVSTADVHEYKSTTKAQIRKAATDIEREWGGAQATGCEWLVLYVRPFELDIGDRNARWVTTLIAAPGRLVVSLGALVTSGSCVWSC